MDMGPTTHFLAYFRLVLGATYTPPAPRFRPVLGLAAPAAPFGSFGTFRDLGSPEPQNVHMHVLGLLADRPPRRPTFRPRGTVGRQCGGAGAAQEQEVWMARVRAVLASMTWKSGRRRKRSAARAVVGAERVGGGEAAAARAPSTKRGRTPEPDAKQGQFDPGGKTQRTQYGRSYPALDLSPVRREGSTGPERPQRRRPDGQECYVESRLAGAKRRRTGKGEETGMPTGRPPGE